MDADQVRSKIHETLLVKLMPDAMGSPAGQVAALELLEDEKTFVDLPNSPLWIARERPLIRE